MKRVVTGHAVDGKSVFIQNDKASSVVTLDNLPGFEITKLWATDNVPLLPVSHDDPVISWSSFVPGKNGTRFSIVRFPSLPEVTKVMEKGFNIEALEKEHSEKMPGFAEALERENLGMHTTDTIDYIIILSGEVWLELDDEAKVHLKPGDCVIQNGTRHAWRNEGNVPCYAASILIGAERK